MANYLATDTELTQVANKLRAKTGSSSALAFPSGFVAEADKLTDTRDANATAAQILSGKTAYVNGSKVTGNIASKAAATYNVSGSNQTIAAGQYLAGAQTIRGVATANIAAGNIKAGVTVKVGDAADDDRIAGVTGTFTSDATATASDIKSGKTAYVNGNKVTGTYTPTAIKTRDGTSTISITSRTLDLTGAYDHAIGFSMSEATKMPYRADLLYNNNVVGPSSLPVRLSGSSWAAILKGYNAGASALTINGIRVYYREFYL